MIVFNLFGFRLIDCCRTLTLAVFQLYRWREQIVLVTYTRF